VGRGRGQARLYDAEGVADPFHEETMGLRGSPGSDNARLRDTGWLGKVLDVGADGCLSVTGRLVSWAERGVVGWEVDAVDVEVERAPTLIHYDLVLVVRGERWRFIVDNRHVRALTRGLLVAARRRDAAAAIADRIGDAKRL
jgi:hypothetical protein